VHRISISLFEALFVILKEKEGDGFERKIRHWERRSLEG